MKSDENSNYIVESVENKEYFQYGKMWFFQKYTSVYTSKFNLIVSILTMFIIIFIFIISSISVVYNIKVKNGVANLESDFEDKLFIHKIPHKYNNNEANILRFVIENYIETFESYNLNQFNIYKLNDKIDLIKKYSSKSVGEKFAKMVRTNYIPEIFSGFIREAKIASFTFVKEDVGLARKVIDYIFQAKVPNKVIVEVKSNIYNEANRNLIKEETRTIEITFKYKPIERDENDNFGDLNFIVTGYNYLKF